MSQRLAHDWFDAPLPANIEIGEGSWVHSAFAFLHYASRHACGVQIGRHSGLYKGTLFDVGPEGRVVIGDYCTCVKAIISSNSLVTIGDYVFIAHDVVIADHPMARPPEIGGAPAPTRRAGRAITIGDDAWIGARAVLLGGATVGAGAIVGAGAVLDSLVPPGAIAAGNPARIVGHISDRRAPAFPAG